MLVMHELRKGLVGLSQRLLDTLSTRFDAHRQGVDKHPQRPLGTCDALHSAEQNGAKYHVVPPRRFAQHQGPGQVEQAGRADAMALGLLPHPLG